MIIDHLGPNYPNLIKTHPNENYRVWVYRVYATDWQGTIMIGFTFSIVHARNYCLAMSSCISVDGPAYNFDACSLNDVRPTAF